MQTTGIFWRGKISTYSYHGVVLCFDAMRNIVYNRTSIGRILGFANHASYTLKQKCIMLIYEANKHSIACFKLQEALLAEPWIRPIKILLRSLNMY